MAWGGGGRWFAELSSPSYPSVGFQGWMVGGSHSYIITIYVPVVFMARYVMILRGATSLRGALEGLGPEYRDFFGP
jgi:hypothetical protein